MSKILVLLALMLIPIIPAFADYHYEYASSTDISVFNCGLTECIAPSSVTTNQEFTFGFYVTNAGPTSTSVTVSVPLPSGITMVKAVPDQGSCIFASSTVSCNMGTMTYPSPAKKILITAKSTQPYSSTSFTATATPSVQDRNTANNSHIIKGPAITGASSGTNTGTSTSTGTSTCSNCVDGHIHIVPSQTSLKPGDSFQFHLKIGNNGPNTLYFGSAKGNFYNEQGTLPPITVSGLPSECRFTAAPNFSCDYREIYPGQNIQFTLNANVNKDAKTSKFTADATISAGSNKDTNLNNNISSAKGISIQVDESIGGTVADDLAESSGTDRPAIDDTDEPSDTVADDLGGVQKVANVFVYIDGPKQVKENEVFVYTIEFGNEEDATADAQNVKLSITTSDVMKPSHKKFETMMYNGNVYCYGAYNCKFSYIPIGHVYEMTITTIGGKFANSITAEISTTTVEIDTQDNKKSKNIPVEESSGTKIADTTKPIFPKVTDLGFDSTTIYYNYENDDDNIVCWSDTPACAIVVENLGFDTANNIRLSIGIDKVPEKIESKEFSCSPGLGQIICTMDTLNPGEKTNVLLKSEKENAFRVYQLHVTSDNYDPNPQNNVLSGDEKDNPFGTEDNGRIPGFGQNVEKTDRKSVAENPIKLQGEGQFTKRGTPLEIEVKMPDGTVKNFGTIPSSDSFEYTLPITTSSPTGRYEVTVKYDSEIIQHRVIELVSEKVPTWIKNNAVWWGQGQIDDQSFIGGIKFMIENDIMILDEDDDYGRPTDPPTRDSNQGTYHYGTNIGVPSWIKNTAQWWGQGQISEDEFLRGIGYLIENGILQVD